MEDSRRSDVVTSYHYLRAAIPVLVLGLFTSVAYQVAQGSDCFLGSISAYYYTPVRAVFVGALCAIGTCLVINQGSSPWEDNALDVSGYLAFFVAFVPTPLEQTTLPSSTVSCGLSNLPPAGQLQAAITNNVLALLVCGVVVLVLLWWVRRSTGRPTVGRLSAPSLGTATVVLAVVIVVFLARPDVIREQAHVVSAVTLFVGICVVVALNAISGLARRVGAPVPEPRFRRLYLVVLGSMLVTAVVLGLLYVLTDVGHVIFWLEALLIGEFAVFWVVQTVELRSQRARGVAAA